MDALLSAAALLVLAIPMGIASALFVGRGHELLEGFFAPVRPDGWPRGVQEEDPSFVATFRLGPTAVTTTPRSDQDEEFGAPPMHRVSAPVRWRE